MVFGLLIIFFALLSSQVHFGGAIYSTKNGIQATTKQAIHPKEKCGRTISNANEGVIESPGYPLKYKSNSHCEWFIQAPHKSDVIYIYFIDLDVEESSLCLFDYVSLTFENSRAQRFCGNDALSVGTVIVEHGGWTRIQFLTDGSAEKSGFRLAYKVESGNSKADNLHVLLPQTQQIKFTPLPVSTSDKSSSIQTTRYDSSRFKELFRFSSSSKVPSSRDAKQKRTTDQSKTVQKTCRLHNIEKIFNAGDIVRINCLANKDNLQNFTDITCLSTGKWADSSFCKPLEFGDIVDSQVILSQWQIAMLIVTAVACAIYVIFTSYLFVAQRRRISRSKCSRCKRQLNSMRQGRHLANSNYESEDCTFA